MNFCTAAQRNSNREKINNKTSQIQQESKTRYSQHIFLHQSFDVILNAHKRRLISTSRQSLQSWKSFAWSHTRDKTKQGKHDKGICIGGFRVADLMGVAFLLNVRRKWSKEDEIWVAGYCNLTSCNGLHKQVWV
jgi:hypothetical protein